MDAADRHKIYPILFPESAPCKLRFDRKGCRHKSNRFPVFRLKQPVRAFVPDIIFRGISGWNRIPSEQRLVKRRGGLPVPIRHIALHSRELLARQRIPNLLHGEFVQTRLHNTFVDGVRGAEKSFPQHSRPLQEERYLSCPVVI